MQVELLVEEQSAEAALGNILPRILPPDIEFRIHAFNGKQDLLGKLPARLKGYRRYLPFGSRIIVLVDAHRQDCRTLKGQLDQIARAAGLVVKATTPGGEYQLANRIVVQELEAWFFGDQQALLAAYPRIRRETLSRARFRDPDSISGGSSEALAALLRRAGYYRGRMPKVVVARKVSLHMNPAQNCSNSFQVFRAALLEMAMPSEGR